MTYEGYSNYETWAVCLWMDNEQGSYEYMRQLAEDTRNNPLHEFADTIKEYLEEGKPELGNTLFQDLLTSAFDSVDWREVAEHYREDLEPEEDEELEEA